MVNLESNPVGEIRIWNPVFIKVFIINMLTQFCTYTMFVLSAKYADHLGAAAIVVGLVSSLFSLTALIFKLVSAPAIDTFNRKYVLMGSIFILFVSFVGYSLSRTIPMLIVSRLLTGVGLAFVPLCCITLVSDSLPTNKMSTGIGYFALGSALCQAIAPTIGLKLIGTLGYSHTFALLAVVLMLAIVFTGTMKTSFTRAHKFRITLGSIIAREALVPTVILFLLNMTFCNINAFLLLFGEKQGVNANIGYFFTVLAVSMIFTRPVIGKLADKYGMVKVIIPSMICFAGSFVLISYSRTLPMFLAAGFLSAFGYAGCQPVLVALCMKSVPKERRGAASSTSYIGMDLGNLVGPVLAGVIVGRLGYVSMWQIMIFPIFFAMLIGIAFRNRITHAGEEFTVRIYATQMEQL